jgi:hypothetical protein
MSKFTWDKWSYDCDGDAYVIKKDLCPNKEDVPKWIVENDNLDPECLNPATGHYIAVDSVRHGWCKYQIRTDWENCEGEPLGGYFVVDEYRSSQYQSLCNKAGRGWFEVWIVRVGEWY